MLYFLSYAGVTKHTGRSISRIFNSPNRYRFNIISIAFPVETGKLILIFK